VVLHMAHNGQEGGNAFGDYNPAGPHGCNLAALARSASAHDGLRHPPRPHLHVLPPEAALSLRLGLSDTTFAYSNLRTSSQQMTRDGEVTVSVDVRNTGLRAGDEVVQMYVAHLNSKVERPIEELKGFKRIALQPGEMKTVSLPLKATALAYWNSIRGAFEVEPDQVNVKVGSSSVDIKLQQVVSITPE
jgi:beta-glucosidase